jgi:hypothetical protein
MKQPAEHPISLEASSSLRDIANVFFKTPDGLYAVFWTVIFFSLGLITILIPDWNIQSVTQLPKLFLTPFLMVAYVMWHRLGNSMAAKLDIAISMVGTTVLAIVPFYKFLMG